MLDAPSIATYDALGQEGALPPLTVPERFRPGLAAIITLSHDSVGGVVAVLSRAPDDLSSAELGALIASEVTSLPSDTATQVVTSLSSLYLVRSNLELPVPDMVEEIADAMETSGDPTLKIDGDDLPIFKEKLSALLDIEPLYLKWKSRDVLSEYERSLYGARILTDIRPIFDVDPEEDPIDARIVHTLKLLYHEGSEHKEFYIALQDDALDMLRDVLERADAKAKTLRKIVNRVGASRD